MKRIEVQLSKPFEEVLASVLSLPRTLAEIDELRFANAIDLEGRQSARCDVEVKEALRSLYEAAHGGQVETTIGFLPIAPPVASFLKTKPYYVATQHEFFLEAFTRILVGDSPRKSQTNPSCTPGSKRAPNRRGINGPSSHTRGVNGNVYLSPTSSRFARNQQLIRHD
jgi:hypothetical protein